MWKFDKKDLNLTLNFLKLNIRDRYLASTIGGFWAIANPLLMLSIYTFVFGFVYKSKLPGAETTLSYAIWLISGYGPWMSISEGISASTMSVTSSAGMIKNMAFKSEVLPISGALVGFVSLSVTLIFLIVLLFVDGNYLTAHALVIPLVIVIQFIFISAIGLFLSALNVFFRDISYVLPNLLTIILFATPIFYRLDGLPKVYQNISEVNPFYILSQWYRQPLIFHELPSIGSLLYILFLSLFLLVLGLKFFRRLKGHFDSRL